MRLPTITLRQLRFLVALDAELNFSRAAAQCGVTQPTLSAGLRELEERLGVTLVERSRRAVMMTPTGAEIAARARSVLMAAQEIEDLAAAHLRPDEGDLRLGAIPTVGPYLIPRALPMLRDRFPNLRLFLREELTDDLLDGIGSGRLDLVLLAQPYDLGNLHVRVLFTDGYHLAAPPDPAHPPGLNSGDLLLLERGHCLQRHALSAYPDRDLGQDESFSATSLATLVSMVSEGLGITLLPDLAVDAGLVSRQNVSLSPLPDARPRQVVLAWRKTSPRAEVFEAIADILVQARRALA